MYSSPGTPTGTGRSAASSTYSRGVRRRAGRWAPRRPRPRAGTSTQLTSTAASVGPYRLVSTHRAGEPVVEARAPAPAAAPRRCRPRGAATRSGRPPPPPRTAAAWRGRSAASSRRCRSITSCRYSGSRWPSGRAITRRRALLQRPEELPHRHVEAERRLLQHHVVRADAEVRLHPHQAVHDAPVRVHHPLGAAGGAGGVDDVRQRSGAAPRRRVLRALGRDLRPPPRPRPAPRTPSRAGTVPRSRCLREQHRRRALSSSMNASRSAGRPGPAARRRRRP